MREVPGVRVRRLYLPVVMAVAVAGCATKVFLGDESPALNNPDDPFVCPAGAEKRVAARTFRELNKELFGEDFSERGEGFIAPQMVAPPKLTYPGGLFGRKPGFVALVVIVSPAGSFRDPKVVCSTGLDFEKVATASIATAVVRPATQDGVPVESAVLIPVKFELR